MKKIIIISLLLVLVSISAVSAADNATQEPVSDACQDSIAQANDKEILSEGKENLNISIECPDYLVMPERSDYEPCPSVKNLPKDYNERISIYADGKLAFIYIEPDFMDINLKTLKLDYGKHTLLFAFPETEKYNAINITHTLEVTEGYIQIQVS